MNFLPRHISNSRKEVYNVIGFLGRGKYSAMEDAFSAREDPATSHLGQTNKPQSTTSRWQELQQSALQAQETRVAQGSVRRVSRQSAALWDQDSWWHPQCSEESSLL